MSQYILTATNHIGQRIAGESQRCPGLGFSLDQWTGLLGFLLRGRRDGTLVLSLLKIGQSTLIPSLHPNPITEDPKGKS